MSGTAQDEQVSRIACALINMRRLRIKNILVPIDLSRRSVQGIEIAKRIGQIFRATIHVAYVYDVPYATGVIRPALAWQELPISLAEDAREQLAQELKKLASKSGLLPGHKTHFREGAPVFDVICRLAAKIPADLVVVPTRASKGIKRFFLGSTAERLIQHSPCPILVDRKSAAPLPLNQSAVARLRIEKVLVPVDFSGCSLEGLRYAIQFAQEFAAEITVLHVLDLGYSQPMDIRETATLTRFARWAIKDGKEQMQKFIKRVKFGRVRFKSEFVIGTPVEQINNFALANDFDLIITSTHGLTGFKHVLIGSVAEHLVRHSAVPILVVPSHPKVRAGHLADTRNRRSRSHPKLR